MKDQILFENSPGVLTLTLIGLCMLYECNHVIFLKSCPSFLKCEQAGIAFGL